jgi:small multidrug resistance pump
MAWLYLLLAIAFEVGGTTALKMSRGFAELTPSLLIFPAYAVSFVFLALAVKVMPISVAYAVWSGVGTALIAAIGILWFREPVTLSKLMFLGIIVFGVVGLQLSENAGNAP